MIPFNRYLVGLAEMPGSFANEALRAQAIAARSYALVAVQARGQHHGYGNWAGCDCAVYATVRDQHYAGYAKEQGYSGARWVAAVRGTGSLVVRYGTRVVQAFLPSSSGGYTSSNSQWGSDPLPWFPSRSDDPYDRGGGAHRTRTSAGPRPSRRPASAHAWGSAPRPRSARPRCPPGAGACPASPSRVKDGRRTSATVTGAWFRTAYTSNRPSSIFLPSRKGFSFGRHRLQHPGGQQHRRVRYAGAARATFRWWGTGTATAPSPRACCVPAPAGT